MEKKLKNAKWGENPIRWDQVPYDTLGLVPKSLETY